jgi:hypothetical protein
MEVIDDGKDRSSRVLWGRSRKGWGDGIHLDDSGRGIQNSREKK